MYTIKTEYPVALESLDHLYPLGTRLDNSTSVAFIEEMEQFFDGKKINFLDIGCAGGQLVLDMHARKHKAIGIEGSDYSLINKRAGWTDHANELLFTCDATKLYDILEDGQPMMFDCITAWEVLEHIAQKDMTTFFGQIKKHLKPGGIFLASVSMHDKDIQHVTVSSEKIWREDILPKYFKGVYPYPLNTWMRDDVKENSFVFMGVKEEANGI